MARLNRRRSVRLDADPRQGTVRSLRSTAGVARHWTANPVCGKGAGRLNRRRPVQLDAWLRSEPSNGLASAAGGPYSWAIGGLAG
jgi:hypothetical protein